jgi:hypothetical protein
MATLKPRGTFSNPRAVWGLPEGATPVKDPPEEGELFQGEVLRDISFPVRTYGRSNRSRVNLGAGAPSRGGGSRNPPSPATKLLRGGGIVRKGKK